MDRPDILVKVGAAFDRSFDAVLADAEKKWQRAFGAGQGARGGGNNLTGSALATAKQLATQQEAIARQSAKAQISIDRDIYREKSRLVRAQLQEAGKAERQAVALQAQAARQSAALSRQRTQERLQAIQAEERAEKEYTQRLARMKQQAARQQTQVERNEARRRYREQLQRDREIDRFATRTSHRATRFFFPPPEGALGHAKRLGLDIARGAGVDFSVGGGIGRARERETAGMGLANQERIATGSTEGGEAWSNKSLELATQLKVDPGKVTELIRAFTGLSGEFGEAKVIMGEVGAMAIASGADLSEMGSAAGFVFNQLKGIPNAGKMTIEVMRGIVGQTAVGAVEMGDYASQMGRIAANALKFKGDPAENIRKLSALTQLSIATGGATSAADASRATAAFVNTFGKEARISAFAKQGVDLFADQTNKKGKRGKVISSGTVMRDPFEIIKDSIFKTGGDIPKLASMFADTLGRKPVTALANAWLKAGGGGKGSAGEKAIDDEIAKYMGAVMDETTQTKNLAAYHATTAAKAQEFQNRLDIVTTKMSNGVLPAMEKLEPHVIKAAEAFAKVVEWAATNPGEAIVAAITASIARAGIESVGRAIIDRMMVGIGGQILGSGAASTVSGVASGGLGGIARTGGAAVGGAVSGGMGAVANAASVLALGAATFMITDAILNSANTTVNEAKERQARSSNDIFFDFAKRYSEAKTDEERAEIKKEAKANIEQDENSRGVVDRLFGNSDVFFAAMKSIDSFAKQSDDRRAQTSAAQGELAAMGQGGGKPIAPEDIAKALAASLTGKTLEVRVRNTDDFNFTSADIGGGPGIGPPRTDWFAP